MIYDEHDTKTYIDPEARIARIILDDVVTVMQYLDRFVTRVFAVPPEFVEIVRRIEQTAMFMRHALYTIGREGL